MFVYIHFVHLQTGIDDVHNNRWSNFLQIFEIFPCVSSISVWRKYTFGREINELLEMGIHDNFLFISIFQWFDSRYGAIALLKSDNGQWRFVKHFNVRIRQPLLTVLMFVHRLNRAMSPRKMFIITVSAMSSALWPVATQSTFNCSAPRSNACRRNTPQNVQLFFRPISPTILSIVQPYSSS